MRVVRASPLRLTGMLLGRRVVCKERREGRLGGGDHLRSSVFDSSFTQPAQFAADTAEPPSLQRGHGWHAGGEVPMVFRCLNGHERVFAIAEWILTAPAQSLYGGGSVSRSSRAAPGSRAGEASSHCWAGVARGLSSEY